LKSNNKSHLFGIERGKNVLQFSKLNLKFDTVLLKFCSQKKKISLINVDWSRL